MRTGLSVNWLNYKAIFLFIGLCVYSATSFAQDGRITSLMGNVTINGQTATKASVVNAGDEIKTGPNSEVLIIMNDRAMVALSADTTFKISKFNYNNSKPKKGTSTFSLQGMRNRHPNCRLRGSFHSFVCLGICNLRHCYHPRCNPDWSPRGDKIVYTGRAGGRFHIFSIDVDGNEPQRLTSDRGNNEDPSWSPDGRYIVFTSDRRGRYQIHIMQANGQNQQRLTGSGGDDTSPSWSPRLE